jgi:hypothetical protein
MPDSSASNHHTTQFCSEFEPSEQTTIHRRVKKLEIEMALLQRFVGSLYQ